MKYIFLYICILFPCILAKCDQYTTKEVCIDNCWCQWRSGSWKYPDACISPKEDCGYSAGGNCWDNEGAPCYVADSLLLLTKVGLFISGLGGSLLLALGALIVILLVLGKISDVIIEEMKRRNLDHWISYGMRAVGILSVIGILFIICRAAFHMFVMMNKKMDQFAKQ